MHEFQSLGIGKDTLTPTAPLTAIDAEIRIGNLTVREHTGANVEITAEVLVKPDAMPPADANGKRPAPRVADWLAVEQQGGTLRLRNVRADDDHQLRVVIVVPTAECALHLRTQVGSLAAQVVAAREVRVDAAVGSVDVRADSVRGALYARVATGDCAFAIGKSGPASADLEVKTGKLQLELPASTPGTFDCEVATGGLTVAAALGLQQSRSLTTGKANGTRGSGGGTFRLRVAVGQIELR